MTNTGRTPGTILDISRQTDNGTRMEVCIPDVDKDGAFAAAESEKAVKLLHDRQVTLQPGESRLVFFSETAKETRRREPADQDGRRRNPANRNTCYTRRTGKESSSGSGKRISWTTR